MGYLSRVQRHREKIGTQAATPITQGLASSALFFLEDFFFWKSVHDVHSGDGTRARGRGIAHEHHQVIRGKISSQFAISFCNMNTENHTPISTLAI